MCLLFARSIKCMQHENCIITVELFISNWWFTRLLQIFCHLLHLQLNMTRSFFFFWSEWRVLFLYWHATAKSSIDLINQKRHTISSGISLFPTEIYILIHVHVAYIQDNDPCVLKQNVIYFFWKKGIIITQQHFNLFWFFFFPVLTLNSVNTLEANIHVIFWN